MLKRTNLLKGDLNAKPVGNAMRGRRPGRRSDWRKERSVGCWNFSFWVFRCIGSDSGHRPAPPTVERFYRLARACCAYVEELREPFEGAIECDETTIGGARRGKRGWGAAVKVIVLGILQRNGKVKVFDVPARGNKIIRLVRSHTKPDSLYFTDDWHAYGSLRVQGIFHLNRHI